jgi:hypothetical protein
VVSLYKLIVYKKENIMTTEAFVYEEGSYKVGQVPFDEAYASPALSWLSLQYLLGTIDGQIHKETVQLSLSRVRRDLGWLDARKSKLHISRIGVFKLKGIVNDCHQICNGVTVEKARERARQDYELYALHTTPDVNLVISGFSYFNHPDARCFSPQIKKKAAVFFDLYSQQKTPDIKLAINDLSNLSELSRQENPLI